MSEKETEKLIKRAKTDSDRNITYEPVKRPEVANLLRLLSMSTGRTPEAWADDIGSGGAGTLKVELAKALNEFLAPMRDRRQTFENDKDIVQKVLSQGNAKARKIAIETLTEVRRAMKMDYGLS